MPRLNPTKTFQVDQLPVRVYAIGFALALLLSMLSATIPAVRAGRLTIVEALSGR